MNIMFITSEAAPFAKTGGLGDVCGSLPVSLAKKGATVSVMLPLYESIPAELRERMVSVDNHYVSLAWRTLYAGIFKLEYAGVTWYFIDNEQYFKRSDLYGYFDDGERFAFFSLAAAYTATTLSPMPDILHCHDWQTALVPVYLRCLLPETNIKTVFTIHNIEYQGRYGRDILSDVFALPWDLYTQGTMEFHGGISLMKGAIEMADYVTTVSPTYAEELQYSYFSHGLEGVLCAARHKLTGILNGIDTDLFDPENDPALVRRYSAAKPEGKVDNKLELQKQLGLNLDKDIPLIGIVSRLVRHKGIDLITSRIQNIMDMDVQMVVLGRGDWNYEQQFINAAADYPGRLSANIMYSFDLANRIYAGCDIFVMPSMAEPCGLSQMIAMRYGAVPVVRETGGLRDTVSPYLAETGDGNGFTFAHFNADDMLYVLARAVETYTNPATWKTLMHRGMTADFSWSKSAGEYMDIYRRVL